MITLSMVVFEMLKERPVMAGVYVNSTPAIASAGITQLNISSVKSSGLGSRLSAVGISGTSTKIKFQQHNNNNYYYGH